MYSGREQEYQNLLTEFVQASEAGRFEEAKVLLDLGAGRLGAESLVASSGKP